MVVAEAMKNFIVIPGEMVCLNEYIDVERANRYGAAAIKKAETDRVAWTVRALRVKPITDLCDFRFIWYVPNKRKDPDNIHFSAKFLFDGLVEAGVLPKDSQRYVGAVLHERIQIDAKNPRVIVEIMKTSNVETNQQTNGGEQKI